MRKFFGLCLLLLMSAMLTVANTWPPGDSPGYSIEKCLKKAPATSIQVMDNAQLNYVMVSVPNSIDLPYIRAVNYEMAYRNGFNIQLVDVEITGPCILTNYSCPLRDELRTCTVSNFQYPIKTHLNGIPVPFHSFSQPFT